jgi:curved DNA-binding protein CbpA
MTPNSERKEEQGGEGIKELILRKYALLKQGDYFSLLGVTRDADQEAIKNAYFALVKLLHPDVLARFQIRELQKEAIEVFKAINEAYQVLSDKRKRILYEQSRSSGKYRVSTPTQVKAQKDAVEEARVFFHKGMQSLQRRVYNEAQESFKRACELDPKTGRYLAYLGHAYMMDETIPETKRKHDALDLLQKAVELSPEDHEVHYLLSLYYKTSGDTQKQKKALRDALEINPKHIESAREMRLLTMRLQKQKSGFLNRLLEIFQKFGGKKGG